MRKVVCEQKLRPNIPNRWQSCEVGRVHLLGEGAGRPADVDTGGGCLCPPSAGLTGDGQDHEGVLVRQQRRPSDRAPDQKDAVSAQPAGGHQDVGATPICTRVDIISAAVFVLRICPLQSGKATLSLFAFLCSVIRSHFC